MSRSWQMTNASGHCSIYHHDHTEDQAARLESGFRQFLIELSKKIVKGTTVRQLPIGIWV
jgi:hypothetical protein